MKLTTPPEIKKILILKFPYSSLYGGGEHHTLTVARAFLGIGWQIKLVSSCQVLLREFERRKWPVKKIWAPKEPVSKGALFTFPFTAPIFFSRLLALIMQYRLKGYRYLYCLSLAEKVLITIPARLLGMKVVWVEHVTFERWLTLNPLRPLFVFSAKFAQIIAISQVIKDQVIKLGVFEKRVKVIYNGFDLSQKPTFHDYQARVNKNDFVIGTVGRLEKEKGMEYLIQAMKIVKEHIPLARLVVVGDGQEKKNLIWLARELDLEHTVQFVGFQRNILRWIAGFDLFVLPSARRESFGLVLVEAMSVLRPVIGTNIGGIPEIIEDKKDGLLVAPGSASALAEAIIYIFNHPEEAFQMIQKARKKVEEKFDLTITLEKMVSLFEKL